MNVTIVGRIDMVEFINGKNYTILTSPARDAYSQPSRYKLRSDGPIGAKDQVIQAECILSGSVRANQYIDKETRQNKVFQEFKAYLDVISCGAPAYEKSKG